MHRKKKKRIRKQNISIKAHEKGNSEERRSEVNRSLFL